MATSKEKSKAKTTRAPKESSSTSKIVETRRVKTVKSIPGVDEIRLKAQEIYNDRLVRGEQGTAEDDWLKAEKLLKR
jgi:hypothetical protein